VANSTTIIADLNSAIANGPSATTLANAINPTALTGTGGSANLTGGTGIYGSGTYYGGIMDYNGAVKTILLKMQECAVLLAKILVNTDQGSDGTNQTLLVKILNDLQ
jgi:hypothetical protein